MACHVQQPSILCCGSSFGAAVGCFMCPDKTKDNELSKKSGKWWTAELNALKNRIDAQVQSTVIGSRDGRKRNGTITYEHQSTILWAYHGITSVGGQRTSVACQLSTTFAQSIISNLSLSAKDKTLNILHQFSFSGKEGKHSAFCALKFVNIVLEKLVQREKGWTNIISSGGAGKKPNP